MLLQCTGPHPRFVFSSLVGKGFHLFLDVEPIRPGEGEVVAARRLFDRVHRLHSRAYDIVLGDALYLEGPFSQGALERGKDVLAVLKRGDLNLFEDAEALFDEMEPVVFGWVLLRLTWLAPGLYCG